MWQNTGAQDTEDLKQSFGLENAKQYQRHRNRVASVHLEEKYKEFALKIKRFSKNGKGTNS